MLSRLFKTSYLTTPKLSTSSFSLDTDKQAALRAIDDLADHPGLCASIIFRRHLDHLLSSNNDLRVELSWIPGHEGFTANEEADRLAKEAVSAGPPLFKSTISWALERYKSSALKSWKREWQAKPHTNLASVALQKPPALHLAKFHKEYGGPRHVHTRVVQTILGHGFTSEFYHRFIPNLPSECPCGTMMIQTRSHILADCPDYNLCDARPLDSDPSRYPQGPLRSRAFHRCLEHLLKDVMHLTQSQLFFILFSYFRTCHPAFVLPPRLLLLYQ